MQVGNASNYLFSSSVRPAFSNLHYPAAKNPIGITLTKDSIVQKTQSLKEIVAGVDLRNITAEQLAKVGVALYHEGEISDISAGSFVVGTGDMSNRNNKFDAIEYFENILKISKTDRSLRGATEIYSDTLYTIYNLDRVIRASKGDNLVDVFA